MQYRRAFVPGGSFFFTVVTADRRRLFADDKNIGTLPPGDADFATRWRLIKTWFTKHCDADGVSGYALLTRPTGIRSKPDERKASKRELTLWQHRYWEHLLRDETDYRRHVEYIHFNPVKHEYVKSPMD